MKQPLIALVALLSLLISSGLGIIALGTDRSRGPVYSVAAVLSGLTDHPAAWVNRTVLVRGIAAAMACTGAGSGALCGSPQFTLRDPNPGTGADWLGLAWTDGDPLPAFLHHLPAVGAIFPASQRIRWDVVAVYRVQLRAEHACSCACYEAVLLDVAP
jgi:hypothetical protein